MKKLAILLLGILLMGCSTQSYIVVCADDTGYMVNGKDTTLLETQDVINMKRELSKYDGVLIADLRQSVLDFYDGDVDLDTLSLPF